MPRARGMSTSGWRAWYQAIDAVRKLKSDFESESMAAYRSSDCSHHRALSLRSSVFLVMRSIAARQLAETRAASIAELAAAKQDLKWVREDAERQDAGARLRADAARQGRTAVARHVSGAGRRRAEGQPRLVPRSGEDVLRGLSAADRRDAEQRGPAARRGRARARRSVFAAVRTGRRARIDGQHAVARAADAGGARALGRDAASTCRRDRRNAAAVRLRRAAAASRPTTAGCARI